MSNQQPKPHAPKRLLPQWLEGLSIGIFLFIALSLVPNAWLAGIPGYVAVLIAASIAWLMFVAAVSWLEAVRAKRNQVWPFGEPTSEEAKVRPVLFEPDGP